METTTDHAKHKSSSRRIRRAAARRATAAAVSSTALVLVADAAHARIAVNHNEHATNDR